MRRYRILQEDLLMYCQFEKLHGPTKMVADMEQ